MKRGETYSSGWLKSQDMLDKGLTEGMDLTIKSIRTSEMNDGGVQRVLAFNETDQELGLNATNWDSLAELTGKDDDDLWLGFKFNAYPHKLDRPFNGKTHGIRIRGNSARAASAGGNSTEDARKAAFVEFKKTLLPDLSREQTGVEWNALLAKVFPGKKQTALTVGDWQTVKAAITGYDPAAEVQKDNDLPF